MSNSLWKSRWFYVNRPKCWKHPCTLSMQHYDFWCKQHLFHSARSVATNQIAPTRYEVSSSSEIISHQCTIISAYCWQSEAAIVVEHFTWRGPQHHWRRNDEGCRHLWAYVHCAYFSHIMQFSVASSIIFNKFVFPNSKGNAATYLRCFWHCYV